jgi:hypothetical protein
MFDNHCAGLWEGHEKMLHTPWALKSYVLE